MLLEIRPDALALKDRELGFLSRLAALGGRATLEKLGSDRRGVCSSRYSTVCKMAEELEKLGFVKRHKMHDAWNGWIEVEIIKLNRSHTRKPVEGKA